MGYLELVNWWKIKRYNKIIIYVDFSKHIYKKRQEILPFFTLLPFFVQNQFCRIYLTYVGYCGIMVQL